MMRTPTTTRSRAPGLAAATSLVVLASMLANAPAAGAWEWQGTPRERQDVRSVAQAVAKVARDLLVQPQAITLVRAPSSTIQDRLAPAAVAPPVSRSLPKPGDRVAARLLDLPPPVC